MFDCRTIDDLDRESESNVIGCVVMATVFVVVVVFGTVVVVFVVVVVFGTVVVVVVVVVVVFGTVVVVVVVVVVVFGTVVVVVVVVTASVAGTSSEVTTNGLCPYSLIALTRNSN